MARANLQVIEALRRTAARLKGGAEYDWSHQGSCNCGHLVQTITHKSRAEIHALALQKAGDWGEKAIDYCPTSRYPIDHIITAMLEMGFTTDDLFHLERLSASKVLERIPQSRRPLQRNRREDVILYMETWAEMLEEERAEAVVLPELTARRGVPA
ncbi:MAG: hypothetical protein D6743_00770 [Calditrichaeota bacterium]|nr:MAG: hypothetical protein D6743_00770 [Calditrichota bacterium]